MSLILLLVASILALLRPSWMVLRIWSLWRFTLDPSSCITGILLWLAHQNQRFSSASASSTEVIFRIRRSLNNSLQVINQYVENSGNFDNRYDVTILVNGFPLVHIELKRRGVALKEAFNQIECYQRDSFWAASGLYEYVQLFVISNGTHTKYYSNTTRISAIKERDGKKIVQKTSSSFEFTSFWADANNKVIPDLVDFTRTFFQKHTLLNIITKYCVLTNLEHIAVDCLRLVNELEMQTVFVDKVLGNVSAH